MTEYEKEIKEIIRIIAGLERASEENDPQIDKQIKKIEVIFSDFNKKYPKLFVKLEKKIDGIYGRIFINESSVKKIFDEVASKISGLSAIGLTGFDEVNISNGDQFSQYADKITNKVFLTYGLDIGTETIILELDAKENKVELNFEIKSIVNKLTPQAQLLTTYANMQQGENIELLSKCYELGFVDMEDETLFSWEDEFWPKMLD